MARDFDRQVAEAQIRIAVMNRYTALGISATESRGMSPSGERGSPGIIRFVQQSHLAAIFVRPLLFSHRHYKPRADWMLGYVARSQTN